MQKLSYAKIIKNLTWNLKVYGLLMKLQWTTIFQAAFNFSLAESPLLLYSIVEKWEYDVSERFLKRTAVDHCTDEGNCGM
jgi:hypothetical protein